jgi:ferredoxin
MRVVVDRDLCQGHAMCVLEDADVFHVGAHDEQVQILMESPDEAHRPAVENAAKYCPTGALSIEESS